MKRQGVLTEDEFQSAKQRIFSDVVSETEKVDETTFSDESIEEAQSFDLQSWLKEQHGFFAIIGASIAVVAAVVILIVLLSSSSEKRIIGLE